MKKIILLSMFFASLTVFCQTESNFNDFHSLKNTQRILKSHFYAGSSIPLYITDYNYNEHGLLQSINRVYHSRGNWLEMETREYKYNANEGSVICIYKPSEEALNDHVIRRRIRNKPGDIDTFLFDNRKLTYLSQFRKGDYNDYIDQHIYTYENGLLVKLEKFNITYVKNRTKDGIVTTPSKPHKISELGFIYEGNLLINIMQVQGTVNRKWVLNWNGPDLESVLIYNIADEKEDLVIEYECISENGKLMQAINYIIHNERKMAVEQYLFKYDDNGNLHETSLEDDTGASGFRIEYEPGNGNASVFEEKKVVFDFIKPSIK